MLAERFDAVIVAGGRGRRMGGVEKALLRVHGQRLLDLGLEACADAAARVVVGRVEVPEGVIRTMEDPPGGGPAAGLWAGLCAIEDPQPWTLVLAVDHPDVRAAVARLHLELSGAPSKADGVCMLGTDGHPQLLLAFYRSEALRGAFERIGDPTDLGLWRVLKGLTMHVIDVGDVSIVDLDTPEQLAAWERTHPAG